jgi:GMP synthase-like glutamine amidotransferase
VSDQGQNDPILAGLKETETVMHWHQDTFDLPPGAVHLASSEITRNQAFRLGRHVYGLQFHMEVTPELLAEWLEDSAVQQQLVDSGGSPERLLEQSKEHDKRLRWLCHSVLNRLVHLM